MRFLLALLLSAVVPVCAQTAAAPVPAPEGIEPGTVVATIDGRKLTAGELRKFVAALPPNVQQNYNADKKEFVRQYAMLRRLASMAEKAKLDQESPHKERIEYSRTQVMVQAQIDATTAGFAVSAEEQEKLYQQNRERYRIARIKGIFVPFAPPGAPVPAGDAKALSEEDAKAEADEIVKQARGGADFVKLVKKHSRDAESRAKDGDFGTVTPAMRVPDSIKLAIFGLKKGEISEPVRENSGFFIFKAEETGQRSFDDVREEIGREIRQTKLQQWLDSVRQALDVRFDNEAFFEDAAPLPAAK